VISVLPIPTTSNSNSATALDTDASDPTRKAELERLTDEHASHSIISRILCSYLALHFYQRLFPVYVGALKIKLTFRVGGLKNELRT